MSLNDNHTTTQYMSLAQAFEFLNSTLFDGTLPSVLVTLQRRANSRGYFAPGMFAARVDPGAGDPAGVTTTDEIALNPDNFVGRTDEQIFSTLAHEMTHLWQQVRGKAPTRAYHDKQWADKMESIGLMPSDTGLPGGKRTGAKCTHYIMLDGPFARAYGALRAQGLTINWQSAPRGASAAKKTASKTKFTCSNCAQNAWAKPTAKIACVPCDMPMLADDGGEDDA